MSDEFFEKLVGHAPLCPTYIVEGFEGIGTIDPLFNKQAEWMTRRRLNYLKTS